MFRYKNRYKANTYANVTTLQNLSGHSAAGHFMECCTKVFNQETVIELWFLKKQNNKNTSLNFKWKFSKLL